MQIRSWNPVLIFPWWIPILFCFFLNMHLKLQRNCTLVQSSLLKLLISPNERLGWYGIIEFMMCDLSFLYFQMAVHALTAWILCRCFFQYPFYSQEAWNSLQSVMRFQSNMSISRICLLLSLVQLLVMDLEEFIWNFP